MSLLDIEKACTTTLTGLLKLPNTIDRWLNFAVTLQSKLDQ